MDGIYWTKGARERVRAAYRALLASARVPLQEIRVPTRNGETCVFACGPADSPPIVLLHGGNTNSAMWLQSLPVWSRHFRVYAVDIIGDPGFSAPTRLPLQTDDHTQWLDDVFKFLNLKSASIVGASFGGWIALEFAIRRSSAVSRLMLLAPAGLVRVSIAATFEISSLMLMGAWGRRRALLRLFGLVKAKLTEEQKLFLAFSSVVQLNTLSRLKVPAPIPDEQLSKLSARTHVVLGGRDILFNSDAASRRLQALCPGVTVSIFPDAGHGLVEPTELVLDFLSAGQPCQGSV